MTGDLIQLQAGPLDTMAAMAAVSDNAAGGIAMFLGVTRAEENSSGQQLLALDYQAYDEMALRQFNDFAARARQKWPILRLAILHRTGRVEVGRPSVLIAVCTPHRHEAFESCRFLIDILKAEVAIWKKEIWADGSASWVHPRQQDT